MSWQFTPYSYPLLVVAAISAALLLYAWRRRDTTGAKTLAVLMAGVCIWAAGYALELSGADLSTKIFWAKAEYIGIAAMPVAWLAFALQYTGRQGRLTGRNLVLLSAIPLVTLLLAWTNESHELIWSSTRLDRDGPFPALEVNHDAWFWIHWSYSYLLLLVGTILLISMLARSLHLYRKQNLALLVAAVLPWAGNGVYVLGLSPIPNLDLTPFAFLLSGMAIALGLFRFRLLDIVPVARESVLEGMADGVVVLDMQDRVVDINPAAERFLGCSAQETIGQGFTELVPDWDGLFEHHHERAGEIQVEVSLGKKPARRNYELTLSPVVDRKGHSRGRLILLHDVTERRKAEEDLRQSEELYRSVVEQAAEYIFLVDIKSNRILKTNAALGRSLGYTPEELEDMTIYNLVAHDRQSIDRNAQRVLEEGQHSFGDRCYRRKDGSLVDVEVNASAISYKGSEAIVIVAHDITERKRAQERVQKAEEKYQTLVEQMPAVTYIDPAGDPETSLFTSPQIEKMLGYTPEEWQTNKLWPKRLHPEDRERVLAADERFEAGERQYSEEYRLLAKDGAVVWVREEAVTVEDEAGKPLYWQGVIFDITERKMAEEEIRQLNESLEKRVEQRTAELEGALADLRESEKLYRTVVEQAAEHIFLVDIQSKRILETNAALGRSLGYTPEELKDMTLYDIAGLDKQTIDQNIELILAEGPQFIDEQKALCKDGSVLDVEVNAGVISYGGKEALCVVGHDITERKKANDSLRHILDVLFSLYEASQVLGSTLESEEIIARLLEIMQRVLNLTSAVISLEDDAEEVHLLRSVGLERLWPNARFAPEAVAARRAALDGGQLTPFRLRHPESAAELVGLYLPLKSKERVLGVLEVYGQESLAQRDTVDTLISLASQAASALENARLYQEVEEREQRLQELVGKLLRAQEEELRRISYEVHDGFAQLAVAAHQRLQALVQRYPPTSEKSREDLERVLGLVRQTVTEARKIIAGLRPTELDDFGLAAAIQHEVDQLRADGWHVEYELDLGGERLPDTLEITLYRVAQEALTNARKHAGTERVSLELRRLGNTVIMNVEDHGRGFDPDNLDYGSGPGERMGLSGMRERVGMVGGEIEVRSSLGEGTSVKVRVPVPE